MEKLLMLVIIAAGIVSLAAGVLCVGTSAYLFTRRKTLALGPAPLWMIALAAGLFLTLVILGAAIFLLMQAIMAPPPPVVTCYEVQPEVTCYKPAASVILTAVPITMRLELAEKLRESGKLPEHVYNKIRK
ncbi:hypothetical protein [Methanocella sp. MCL-LM]|uniref:hypothetical protein n=1 Tax=Methanocella sp. MCL-LM TaxID=3412035 RepID=UPI003C745F69